MNSSAYFLISRVVWLTVSVLLLCPVIGPSAHGSPISVTDNNGDESEAGRPGQGRTILRDHRHERHSRELKDGAQSGKDPKIASDEDKPRSGEEAPPDHVIPSKSYRPYARWSKFKFNLLEIGIAILALVNLVLFGCLGKCCLRWKGHADGASDFSKRYAKKYVGLNPNDEEDDDDDETESEEDDDEDDDESDDDDGSK